jgi:CheY-like chemotaxis protein
MCHCSSFRYPLETPATRECFCVDFSIHLLASRPPCGTVRCVLAALEPTAGGAPRARIWLVDDDTILQGERSRRRLTDLHDVEVFSDGATMLEALRANGQPDLLVLDWPMPNMSGLELCRFIRETRDATSLPILILTATDGDNLTEAFTAGANDFVRKPYPQAEFDARVAALLRNRRIHAKFVEAEQRLRVEGEFRERFIGCWRTIFGSRSMRSSSPMRRSSVRSRRRTRWCRS